MSAIGPLDEARDIVAGPLAQRGRWCLKIIRSQ